jgi:hypothetical protein
MREKSSRQELETERASKVTFGRKTVEIRELYFAPLHLQVVCGGGGGAREDIYSLRLRHCP